MTTVNGHAWMTAPPSQPVARTEGTHHHMERQCRVGLAFTLPALLLVCVGCAVGSGSSSATAAGASPTRVSDEGPVQHYTTLVATLTAAGASVQPGQEHPPDNIFDAPSRELLVNGSATLSVFEYATAAAAKARASCFHNGDKRCPGDQVGFSIDYVAPPHLYLAGRI